MNTPVSFLRPAMAVLALVVAAVMQLSGATPLVQEYRNPVYAGSFPDPSAIRVGDEYWAVGTSGNSRKHFPIMRSRDMVTWEAKGHVFTKTPAWAKNTFWAPELSEHKGTYYIYYTARGHDGRLAVAVATAPHPAGPWQDRGVVVVQDSGSIDAMAYTDETGARWLFWKEDGNSRKLPTPIWMQRLSEDGLSLEGKRTEVIRNDIPWEEGVVEGPYVLRHGEYHYLFYSGSGCCGTHCRYALGVARAKSLQGPWEKCPVNPILKTNDTWRCPGHGTIVTNPDGRYWLVYHAYPQSEKAMKTRQMLLDEVVFGADGWPSINRDRGPSTRAPAPVARRAPNIVVILADDLGRSDLGYAGSDIRTPNIDRIAASGVKLDRFYACPVCSPTRAGLLTGRWPIRQGIMRTVIPPWSKHGLPLEETTLAEALAKAGYERRGIFGKWHLGHSKQAYLPPQRGFTHFYGHYNGALDYFTHEREGETDWHRGNETVKEEGYTTDLVTREAVRFVEETPANAPFFLYLPYNAPHAPYQAKPEDLARYPQREGNRKAYAAMVDSMDQGIGRVLAAIAKRPDADNTFVLFMSDNGGHQPTASNAPMRDGKFSVYEGGIRVAALVRWPAGGLSGGRTCAEPMGYIDVFPTVMRMAGIDSAKAAQRPLDGRDVLDVMRGKVRAPERPWFSYIAPQTTENAAVSVGRWKLVLSGGAVLGAKADRATKVELFNLDEDPGEKNNLAAAFPERVAQLRAHLAEFGKMQMTGVAAYGEGRKKFKAPKDWVIKE